MIPHATGFDSFFVGDKRAFPIAQERAVKHQATRVGTAFGARQKASKPVLKAEFISARTAVNPCCGAAKPIASAMADRIRFRDRRR